MIPSLDQNKQNLQRKLNTGVQLTSDEQLALRTNRGLFTVVVRHDIGGVFLGLLSRGE